MLVDWSVVREESGQVSQESYVEVVVHIFVQASPSNPLVAAVAGKAEILLGYAFQTGVSAGNTLSDWNIIGHQGQT